MGGLLTGNLCRTYFWNRAAICMHYLSIYLLMFFWYKLHDQMFYEKPYIVFYKCKCAKFLSSTYSMDCFILLASFANLKFEVVHIFLSLPYLL